MEKENMNDVDIVIPSSNPQQTTTSTKRVRRIFIKDIKTVLLSVRADRKLTGR